MSPGNASTSSLSSTESEASTNSTSTMLNSLYAASTRRTTTESPQVLDQLPFDTLQPMPTAQQNTLAHSSPFPTLSNLTQFYPSTNVHFSSPKPPSRSTGTSRGGGGGTCKTPSIPLGLMPHIVFWIDDHPENNATLEEDILADFSLHKQANTKQAHHPHFFSPTRSKLTILRFKSTTDAIRRITQMHHLFQNAFVRIVTDMARYESMLEELHQEQRQPHAAIGGVTGNDQGVSLRESSSTVTSNITSISNTCTTTTAAAPVTTSSSTTTSTTDSSSNHLKFVPNAGELLIKKLLRAPFYRNSSCLWIKIYNSKVTRPEIEAYLRFWPWYLSLGWDFWRNATNGFLGVSQLVYYEYDVSNWNVQQLDYPTRNIDPTLGNDNNTHFHLPKTRHMCNKFEIYLVESIINGVRRKLEHTKDVCNFSLQSIKFVYNSKLWKSHRALYKTYWTDLREEMLSELNDEDNLTEEQLFRHPKRLIAFHGTARKNFASIFKEGFDMKRAGSLDSGWYGKSLYVSSHPQYAAHYIHYQGTDPSSKGFKFPVSVGQDLELIAGFCIPGKKAKIQDFAQYNKSAPKDNSQAHFVRVAFKKQYGAENFFPINDNQKETADEIVLFDSAQFLPCFLMTLKRTK